MSEVEDSQQCSFMVYGKKTSWSTTGCKQVYNTTSDGRYSCKCNHTTDFAILLLLTEPNIHVSIILYKFSPLIIYDCDTDECKGCILYNFLFVKLY